ncbi:cation acetate symporter [Brevibacillus fulvus]|uniref:Cation/acetate symporter n=1 Tax=Brevibacillus fulvus TaxID=1125967 RepID=A0A939BTI3_9BACL|nr:cation acetate symporter [Brevibacillus fulvus]MBM7588481.1 cation/acetate symporter [Brevibacillus fulvus]
MNITVIVFFLAVVVGTLAITYSAAKRTSKPLDFYAAGNRLTGMQNGWAIAGDYMSAASFLGITGAIASYGFDGFFYSIGFLVSYLVILLTVAEPLHNLGQYTLADSIAIRFPGSLLRSTVAASTLSITIFYMIAQLVGAGALIHLLLDLDYRVAVLLVGTLMTSYVVFGGMVATSWVQIIKAILLLSGTLIVSLIVLARFDWSVLKMFEHVKQITPLLDNYLNPGNQFVNPLDTISLHLALIMGTAGLPHILIRLFTVRSAVQARRSILTATWLISVFYIMTVFLGFGASSFVGWQHLQQSGYGGNLTLPLLSYALGGDFLMAYISAVAFATILAVVTGLVLSASSAFAHDLYSHILRKGGASEREQLVAAKSASLVVGAISTLIAIHAENMNVAILVALTFAVAASANLPLILFTLYWRRFTETGAIAGVVTGMLSAVILVVVGPHVMNPLNGMIKLAPWFPLSNPGIVSIPLGFLGGIVGTLVTFRKADQQSYEALLVRAHTGVKGHPNRW